MTTPTSFSLRRVVSYITMIDRNALDNLPLWTVSDLSQALKRTVEGAFPMVRLKGEVSGFKRAGSGHCYLCLKDEEAMIDAVCWRGTVIKLSMVPEDGMEVVVTGRLTTYPGRSKYQIVIESLELAGEGALLKLLEERRRKLAAEGLFDDDRKRPLPFLPEVIGVVTSPTGAVIRDILHRLSDRFPLRVLVWPVLVQGEGAAQQIAAAIEGFNGFAAKSRLPRPDLLIVARGGGSLEDLWAFNEEIVVRAAAGSDIPLISAVGHETDTTLIDFASDRRAPTPTAAAEMAVPVRTDLLARVMDDGLRLYQGLNRLMSEQRIHLKGLSRGLPDPRRLLEEASQRLDERGERLLLALKTGIAHRASRVKELAAQIPHPRQLIRHERSRLVQETRSLARAGKTLLRDSKARLSEAGKLLESLSYQKVLRRGYAVVRDAADNKPLTSAASVKAGTALTIEMNGGNVEAVAGSGGKVPATSKKQEAPPKRKDQRQGELL
jgi:exodeoxyribonuclease VII large subunit